jgi:hypothetical protein
VKSIIIIKTLKSETLKTQNSIKIKTQNTQNSIKIIKNHQNHKNHQKQAHSDKDFKH